MVGPIVTRTCWRDPFVIVVALSLTLHGAVAVWAWFSPVEELPVPLALQEGRVSVAIREMSVVDPVPLSSDVAIPQEREKPLFPLPEPPPLLPDPFQRPELPVKHSVEDFQPAPREERVRLPKVEPQEERKPAEQPQPAINSRESQGADVDQPTRIFFNPAPPYPPDALAAGLEGRVLLRVWVGIDGRVSGIGLHESSGVESLDQSALATVQRYWRFTPARKGGVAVSQEVIVPVRFTIRR
jgi:protein TonB